MKIPAQKSVARLKSYQVPCFAGPGKIKLDANENPYDLPLGMKKVIFKELSQSRFNRYPDAEALDLRKALAGKIRIPKEWITAGNGSDELILYLVLAFARGKIIFSTPTFAMYKLIGLSCGAKVVDIPLDNNFKLDTQKIIREKGVSIIFISTPNNPTGNLFSREEVLGIIKKSKALVVIDEAYAEFCGETYLLFLKRFENLVILRSFSKAFGLAGVRLGFMLGPPYLVELVNKVRLPYNLGLFNQIAGRVILENYQSLLKSLTDIIKERERIFQNLRMIDGLFPYRSQANFILFRTSFPSARLFNHLIKRGIIIRHLQGEPALPDCLRVTIGKQTENDLFLKAVRSYFK